MLLWIAKRVFEDDKLALADILSMEHALQEGEHADVMGEWWLDIKGIHAVSRRRSSTFLRCGTNLS